MNAAIFTICSKNYLGQAQTLMASVSAHEPLVQRYIVVVDRKSELPTVGGNVAEIIWAEDLEIEDFERKAFIFDVLELNTNVKPNAFLRLLRDHDRCVYMDPDTVLYSALEAVWRELNNANVLLTPHTIEPRENLACPWEQDLLRYGGYNLGFAAVRRTDETLRLLNWWADRCLTRGFHAPPEGFFVDQKFMDHAAMFFDGVQPMRHPGMNVAYWNLHERSVRREGDTYHVGEFPLVFCHFSGFIFEPVEHEQDLLTKYPCEHTLATLPVLRDLWNDYRQRLRDNNHAKLKRLPYSFACFNNGFPVPRLVRRIVGIGVINSSSQSLFDSKSDFYKQLEKFGLIQKLATPRTPRSQGSKAREARQARFAERVMRRIMLTIGISHYERLLRLMESLASPFNQAFLVTEPKRRTKL